MDCIEVRPKIAKTVETFRNFSFEEKKKTIDEQSINVFLDTINDFKDLLSEKTLIINNLVVLAEKVTWFENLDDDSLKLVNDLVSSIRDVHTSLFRNYISMRVIRDKGIAKNEIKSFKHAIDDLKDVASDIESVFFFLPSMPDFKETTKLLSSI